MIAKTIKSVVFIIKAINTTSRMAKFDLQEKIKDLGCKLQTILLIYGEIFSQSKIVCEYCIYHDSGHLK